MTAAKAWYYLGLGVLTLSFLSSGTARSAMNHASAYVSCARLRMLPYLGTIEMALGRSQSGYGQIQASIDRSRARAEAAQARVQAQQAQIQAVQAMLQERRVQQQLRRTQELMNNRQLMNRAIFAPEDVIASSDSAPMVEVVNPAGHVIVCPRTGVRVSTPAVHVSVTGMQEPI